MKFTGMKTLLLMLFMGTIFTAVEAQKTRSDIFEDEEVTFYGLDFSEAQMIGSMGFTDPYEIKNSYFYKWNRLLFAEKEKYNVKKFYRKSEVNYNFDVVDARNDKVDEDALVIDKSYKIDEEKLKGIVGAYNSKDPSEGLGLVYIIESLDKTDASAYVWVTFFDIKTSKILMSRRMRGKARGFGFRNYWAGAIYDIMKQSEKLMKSWEKE